MHALAENAQEHCPPPSPNPNIYTLKYVVKKAFKLLHLCNAKGLPPARHLFSTACETFLKA